MFFNYIFLLTNFHENGFVPQAGYKTSVIIPISKELWQDKKYYIQKLSSSSFEFCFAFLSSTLEVNRTNQRYLQDSLSTFFFLPNYMKEPGTYLLVADSNARKNKNLSSIEALLKKQGIAPLSKNFISEDRAINNINNNFYYDDDFINAVNSGRSVTAYPDLFKYVVSENVINKHLIIPVKDEGDYKLKEQAIGGFEQWVAENEHSYLELLTAFKRVNSNYQHLESENQKLRFRIDNYNDYLMLLRETALLHANENQRVNHEKQLLSQQRGNVTLPSSVTTAAASYNANEVYTELNYLRKNREEIMNWYLKEYEVLPLWYKRFGHLLKIVSGKRKIKDYLK